MKTKLEKSKEVGLLAFLCHAAMTGSLPPHVIMRHAARLYPNLTGLTYNRVYSQLLEKYKDHLKEMTE